MQRAKIFQRVIVLVAIILAIGCQKEKQPFAHIQLYLKDSQVKIDSLLITIYSVELLSDSLRYSEKIILKKPRPINILQYTNDKDTLLAKLFYDAPFVERIIVTFGSSHWLYRKGKGYPIQLNDTVYNFKLRNPIALKSETINKLFVDFDCYFALQKKQEKWILNPVVRLQSADSTGAVRGKIKSSGEMPFVWLISAHHPEHLTTPGWFLLYTLCSSRQVFVMGIGFGR
ncbi:MAG: DUF4382 domain-containing protein [Bacteroidales bacterium]